MELNEEQIKRFQKHILDWYRIHKRDLPWRRVPYDTRLQQRDPYKILVSEVMLQQTQVSRVIPKYEAWLERFPNMQSLASAKVSEVLKCWSGLGYNRRALYLLKCASTVAKAMVDKQEIWPQTEKELMKLPGIGKYTARALLCFAFDKQIAVVDTNIRKVILTRIMNQELRIKPYFLLHDSSESIEKSQLSEKELENIAEQLLPHGQAYEWNQALMDYSSAMLKHIPLRKSLRLRGSDSRSYGGTSKIPIPKQSKFKDSDRFYRGAIVRFLIKHQRLPFNEIMNLFKKDKLTVENTRLEKIIKGLQKDKLVIQKGKLFFLP